MAQAPALVLNSVLTCPACGAKSDQAMPVDACIYRHECVSCGAMLRPLPGHCCVFCSFGSVPCPPVQLSSRCCSAADVKLPASQ